MKAYARYLKDQITRAESKWGRKWGRKWDYDEIFKQTLRLTWDDVSEYIKNPPMSICCMGCRAGTEVFEFKEYCPSAKVYGVDITDRIDTIRTHLDVTIEKHDFNHLPGNWADKFDLVFSNSLDHAFEPTETVQEWRRVTQAGGHLFLELSTTPANNIEHNFNFKDLPSLLPPDQFEHLVVWKSPERNIITGLFKVIK